MDRQYVKFSILRQVNGDPRRFWLRWLALVGSAVCFVGCAASPAGFEVARQKMSDTRLCRTWRAAAEGSDKTFSAKVTTEAGRRELSWARCEQLVKSQNLEVATAVALAIAAVAIVQSQADDHSQSIGDRSYAWDTPAVTGQTPRCRDTKSGEVVETNRCR